MEGEVIRVGKRVFVGNLAWSTTWQTLKDKFRECGNVVYTSVMVGDDGRSKGWGIVEFEFPEEALAAINAQNGADLNGRRMLVREDREDRDVKAHEGDGGGNHNNNGGGRGGGYGGGGGERAPQPRRERAVPAERAERTPPIDRSGESSGMQVVIQGLPWSFTWRELKDMFASIGDIERADVAIGHDGRSRGFGTVKYTNADAAQRAINQFHQSDLEGRTLAVFLDRYA